jgi:anti-sigma-K factor RskA
MTDASLTPHEAENALAAEYVLGVLDLAERAEAEARRKRDPAFAALVVGWEDRLAGLNDGFEPVPAPDLLPQIEARLFPKAAPQRRRFGVSFGWLSGALVAAVLALASVTILVPPRARPGGHACDRRQPAGLYRHPFRRNASGDARRRGSGGAGTGA